MPTGLIACDLADLELSRVVRVRHDRLARDLAGRSRWTATVAVPAARSESSKRSLGMVAMLVTNADGPPSVMLTWPAGRRWDCCRSRRDVGRCSEAHRTLDSLREGLTVEACAGDLRLADLDVARDEHVCERDDRRRRLVTARHTTVAVRPARSWDRAPRSVTRLRGADRAHSRVVVRREPVGVGVVRLFDRRLAPRDCDRSGAFTAFAVAVISPLIRAKTSPRPR